MANITLGAIRDLLKATADWATGAAAAIPKVKPTGRAAHVSIEGTASIAAGSAAFDVEHVLYIANDSDNDITFNFDAGPAAAGHFVVKAHEVANDIPRACTTLQYAAAADNSSFRALGVK